MREHEFADRRTSVIATAGGRDDRAPLGMSGARLMTSLVHGLRRTNGRYGLATMCIGVGQGIALALERV